MADFRLGALTPLSLARLDSRDFGGFPTDEKPRRVTAGLPAGLALRLAAGVAALLDQLGDEGGPARLVGSAQAAAGVAVEELVEEDVVFPEGIGLKFFNRAVDGAAPIRDGRREYRIGRTAPFMLFGASRLRAVPRCIAPHPASCSPSCRSGRRL